MEKAKIKYLFRTGKRKKGDGEWKGLSVIAESELDGKVYKGIIFSKDDNEEDYLDA